jgi:hypothetical protein
VAVGDIAQGSGGLHATIIKEIRARVDGLNSCNFIYESRNSNVDADSLAKYSLNLAPSRHIWLLQPHDFVTIPWDIVIQ